MSGDIVILGERRADNLGNSHGWTPEECVATALADIRAGRIKPTRLIIHYIDKQEDGSEAPRYFAAKVTHAEHIAMLQVANLKCMESYLGRDD